MPSRVSIQCAQTSDEAQKSTLLSPTPLPLGPRGTDKGSFAPRGGCLPSDRHKALITTAHLLLPFTRTRLRPPLQPTLWQHPVPCTTASPQGRNGSDWTPVPKFMLLQSKSPTTLGHGAQGHHQLLPSLCPPPPRVPTLEHDSSSPASLLLTKQTAYLTRTRHKPHRCAYLMDTLSQESHQLLVAGQTVERELRRHKGTGDPPSPGHPRSTWGGWGPEGWVSYPGRRPGLF